MTNEDICNTIILKGCCAGIKCGGCPLKEGAFNCNSASGELGHRVVTQAKAYLSAQWQPKQGEMVEVKRNGYEDWSKRVFVIKYKGVCYCENPYNHCVLTAWEECRQIKPRHIITIDGKDIELSEESYKALRKSLKE